MHWAGLIFLDKLFCWHQDFLGCPEEIQISGQCGSLSSLWSSHETLGVTPCDIHILHHSIIDFSFKFVPIVTLVAVCSSTLFWYSRLPTIYFAISLTTIWIICLVLTWPWLFLFKLSPYIQCSWLLLLLLLSIIVYVWVVHYTSLIIYIYLFSYVFLPLLLISIPIYYLLFVLPLHVILWENMLWVELTVCSIEQKRDLSQNLCKTFLLISLFYLCMHR